MLGLNCNIPDFSLGLDRPTLRVVAPTEVIFLCGGEAPLNIALPVVSFRDGFMRARMQGRLGEFDVRLAEAALPFFPHGHYRDILNFESDLAQICELTILFPESAGSFTELGAFAREPEIASRMLVVVTQFYFVRQSFISLGPLLSLRNSYGESSVYVLDDEALNIPSDGGTTNLDLPGFRRSMEQAVHERIEHRHEPSRFSPDSHGHVIKLIVGLIQHYGALTLDEIEVSLACLGVHADAPTILKYLSCCKFVEWVGESRTGFRTFFAARNVGNALEYRVDRTSGIRDQVRWRSDVRDYWKSQDAERFRSIMAAAA